MNQNDNALHADNQDYENYPLRKILIKKRKGEIIELLSLYMSM